MDKAVDVSNSVLDYNIDVVYVQASGRYIGCYKDGPALGVTVFIKDSTSSTLIHISMQAHKRSVLEGAELFSVVFCFCEDNNFLVFVFLYEVSEHRLFLAVRVAKKAYVFDLFGDLGCVCAY